MTGPCVPDGKTPADPDRGAAAQTDARIGIPAEAAGHWVESWGTTHPLPTLASRPVGREVP